MCILQESGDFTRRVVSLDWITGGILARSLGGLGKEDKLNYKI